MSREKWVLAFAYGAALAAREKEHELFIQYDFLILIASQGHTWELQPEGGKMANPIKPTKI